VTFPSDLVTSTLDNGLRFVARRVPQIPVVSTMIWYRVGSVDEEPGKTGVAHFLEHMMFKGTGNLRQGQIDRITQSHGGVNNAFTGLDATAYYFNFGRGRWPLALDIEAERMRNCLLDAREFQLEKAVILEERSIEMDSPEGLLLEEVQRTAVSTHPYGHPVLGWLEDVAALQPEDLWRFYEAYYVPNNAHIVMVGDFEVEEALEHIRRRFGSLEPGPTALRPTIREPPQRAERRVLLEREGEAPHLSMAFHVPGASHPDTAALALLDVLLTSGRTSLLHERLVDREKVATSVDSGSSETREPYLFFVHAELHPGGSLEKAEQLVTEELERLAGRGPSRAEMTRAKKLFEADWVFDHQTAEDQAMHLGEALCWGTLEELAELTQKVARLEKQDVQRVAERYFQRTNRTVGHLVPQRRNPGFVALAGPAMPEARAEMPRRRPVRRSGWRQRALPRGVPRLRLEGERFALPNGLQVVVVQDPAAPSFVAELLAPAGSRYEPEAKAGLGALLGRMLAEGTETRSAREVALVAEEMGAKLETSAGYRFARAGIEALSADLDAAMELLADVVQRPMFPADLLEDRRQEQLSFLAQMDDEPRRIGQRWFNGLVYGRHPAHRTPLGTARSVRRLRREDLVEEYRRVFVPGASVLTLAGDVGGPEQVRRLVERHFGAWPAQAAPERPDPPAPRRQRGRRVKVVRKAKEQVHLFFGHLGIRRLDPDFEVAVVLDHVLGTGSGFTDRLSQRLRDREGLAYTVHASLSGSAGIDPGVFLAYVGTAPENVGPALRGIREEVLRLQKEPVPRRELEAVKRYILGQYPFGFQTNRDLVGYAQMCQQFGWEFDHYLEFLEKVETVRPEDVQRVARRCLDAQAFTVVAVGPLGREALAEVRER
jgi:zinc protease